jgi:hypothetical protein
MADAASGPADKSVQVKLVLLGKSLLPKSPRSTLATRILPPPLPLTSADGPHYPGEAAVGKSSVVLRFVRYLQTLTSPIPPLSSTETNTGFQ